MAAHSGQFYTLSLNRQTTKGTPNTTLGNKLKLTGGGVRPVPTIIDLAETDSSIQRSKSVKVGQLVEGTFEGYVRSDDFSQLAYGALGANSTTGSNPYTHAATASNSAPYYTVYPAYDSTALVDRYVDCRFTELSMSGGAGQALSYSATLMGTTATHGETDPVGAPSTDDPLVYPDVTVTLGGVTTDIVESFTVTSTKNAEVIQGDTGMAASDVALGRWSVTGSLTILFETDQKHRAWLTNSTSGTTTSNAIYTEALSIVASAGASDSVTWTMTAVELLEVQLEPDPSGNPLRFTYVWAAQPQATIANTLTVSTVNTTATI